MSTVPGALLDEFTQLTHAEKAHAAKYLGNVEFDSFIFEQDGRHTGTRGNDVYIVEHDKPSLKEPVGNGADLVISDSSIQLTSRIEHAILVGDGDASVEGSSADNLIIGNIGDNTLLGGSGDDLLIGGLGDDCLEGGSGNDIVLGGMGEDCIRGGSGDDCIEGGMGDDCMEGGAGKDMFCFQQGDGQDTLAGFDWRQDTLVFDADLAGEYDIHSAKDLASHAMADVQGNIVITLGDQSITLEGIDINELKKSIIVIE